MVFCVCFDILLILLGNVCVIGIFLLFQCCGDEIDMDYMFVFLMLYCVFLGWLGICEVMGKIVGWFVMLDLVLMICDVLVEIVQFVCICLVLYVKVL